VTSIVLFLTVTMTLPGLEVRTSTSIFRTGSNQWRSAKPRRFCCILVLLTWSGTNRGMSKRRQAAGIRQDQTFKGRQFTAEVILWAVRWYLMFPISYRDLELMLLDRGLAVDHTTIFRWIQAYAVELERRIRPHLRMSNGSWRVDETYVKVKGRWMYLYRAVDSRGQTIDFLLSAKRDAEAAKRFFPIWQQRRRSSVRRRRSRASPRSGSPPMDTTAIRARSAVNWARTSATGPAAT
jgi:DDE domain